ncbi:MAG: ABC transporter substrate-binding protein [Pseudomonadota bacterium]
MLKSILASSLVLGLSALPLNTALAGAASLQPAALVEQAATDIEQARGEAVADTVLSYLNVDMIARFTLGQHARDLSNEDVELFADALDVFLRRQISRHASAAEALSVEIIQTSARNARDTIVVSKVEGFGDPLTLKWRVIERGGQWSVVDLEVQGVWLAIEQRAQIDALLSRPGATIEDAIAQLG